MPALLALTNTFRRTRTSYVLVNGSFKEPSRTRSRTWVSSQCCAESPAHRCEVRITRKRIFRGGGSEPSRPRLGKSSTEQPMAPAGGKRYDKGDSFSSSGHRRHPIESSNTFPQECFVDCLVSALLLHNVAYRARRRARKNRAASAPNPNRRQARKHHA